MGLVRFHFYLCPGGSKDQVPFLRYNLQFHRVDKLGWCQESTLMIEKKNVQKTFYAFLRKHVLGYMLQGE